MMFSDFCEEIKSLKMPVKEAEFPKAKTIELVVKPPFICFLREEDKSIWANGKPRYTFVKLSVELYTEKEDCASEAKLEKWLSEKEIIFSKKERIWISSEKFYMTLYKVTLL